MLLLGGCTARPAPGWRIELEAGAEPLWPQGFDPLNVHRLSAAEVLHSRWIRLGNAAGSLEVLGRAALSEAAGAHPLTACAAWWAAEAEGVEVRIAGSVRRDDSARTLRIVAR